MSKNNSKGRSIGLLLGGFLLFGIILYAANKTVINVDADEIVVTQDPLDGELHVHTTAGLKNQNFGNVVGIYPKWDQFDFDIPENRKDELRYEDAWSNPEVAKYGYKVRFNDDGEAYIFGSLPVTMPLDVTSIAHIQTNQGSWESIEHNIVNKQLNSAVYNVGPLMSSKESSSERRSDLLHFIEDMVENGIYQTTRENKTVLDPVTRDSVNIVLAKQVEDTNAPGGFKRQSRSEITNYNLSVGTPIITQIIYSPKVQDQINKQQELTMSIQIAKARALEAQQNEITSVAEAQAKVARVRADEEAKKTVFIVQAERELEVATLEAKAAEQTKKKLILEGEGEATKKKLIMTADGALKQKLEAYERVNQHWAAAWQNNGASIVPTLNSGGAGGTGDNGANNLATFVDLMSMKAAKDLNLDMKVKK